MLGLHIKDAVIIVLFIVVDRVVVAEFCFPGSRLQKVTDTLESKEP